MDIVFATNNSNKLFEIKKLIKNPINILSLKDIKCFEEIPETSNTLEGNAYLKSSHIFKKYGFNVFSDDSGLEIHALDGRPGVYSARYAGENCNSTHNIKKVLKEMKNITNRTAFFRTIISLIINGKETQFEGVVHGNIVLEEKGMNGFGYDPIFQPIGYDKTFAEMDLVEKNLVSHRSRAVKKLVDFLNNTFN